MEQAGSTLGYKHTPESLEKMRNFVLSDEVRQRKALSTANATAARRVSIIVKNIKTSNIEEYNSLTEAAKALAPRPGLRPGRGENFPPFGGGGN